MSPESAEIFRRVNDQILAVNRAGVITYANEPAARLIGSSPKDLIGRSLWEVFPAARGTKFKHAYRSALKNQLPVVYETSEADNTRWFEVDIYPSAEGLTIWRKDITDRKTAEAVLRESADRYRNVLNLINEAFGLCEVIRDTSGAPYDYRFLEVKKQEMTLGQQEQTLRELNENLEQRVKERTDLAERRAFELRQLVEELGHTEQRARINLAQSLHDHLQQLLVAAKFRVRSLPYSESPAELLEKSRQLEGLINDAIDEARSLAVDLSPPILQERGLSAGLEWLCRRLEEEHGLKVNLSAEVGSEPGTEDMKMFLFQAARELLLNVVNHAGVRQAELSLKRKTSGFLSMTVKDQGAGFDASKVIVRSPTGFGLFNIQQRLELLGGGVEINSKPGGGCEVTLSAPVPLRAAVPPRIPPPRDQPGDLHLQRANSAGQPIRVMIVDDHEILREGLANLLESNSQIEVVGAAGDGAVAVEVARKLRPDVILMDVTMPTMNGIEATRSIKSEMPDCRIIALSMHEREDMEQAMREAGAIAYVSKDVPWDELNSVIQRIVIG